jgi:thioredoxin-related protein
MGSIDRRRFLILLALPAWGAAAGARASPGAGIPLATDLQSDGRLSRERREPIVVLFSLPGCPYCEAVRRSHLAPMLRDPKLAARLIVRQVDVGVEEPLRGFAGERTTHAAVARAHGVRFAPVVAFWDGEGRALAEPLKGMLLPDFYGAYLDDAIAAARAKLAGR